MPYSISTGARESPDLLPSFSIISLALHNTIILILTAKSTLTQLVQVLLGDAPQNDTLASIRKVISLDLFDPKQASQGALFLGFSAFGSCVRESNRLLGDYIDSLSNDSGDGIEKKRKRKLDASSWVSIPKVYVKSAAMLQSLAPVFAFVLFTTALSNIPFFLEIMGPVGSLDWWYGITPSLPESVSTVSSSVVGVSVAGIEPSISASESASIALQSLGSLGSLDLDSIYQSLFINELPWPVQVGIDTSVDFFSVLLLIRMAKLIGTDRDSIIASKVQVGQVLIEVGVELFSISLYCWCLVSCGVVY